MKTERETDWRWHTQFRLAIRRQYATDGGLYSAFLYKNIFRYRHPVAINVKTGMPPFGILANHKIKMCLNSVKKIMIQKITENNWNF